MNQGRAQQPLSPGLVIESSSFSSSSNAPGGRTRLRQERAVELSCVNFPLQANIGDSPIGDRPELWQGIPNSCQWAREIRLIDGIKWGFNLIAAGISWPADAGSATFRAKILA